MYNVLSAIMVGIFYGVVLIYETIHLRIFYFNYAVIG